MIPARHAVLVLAAGIALACRQPEPADPVILALGDGVVRRSDFERHIARLASEGASRDDPALRGALLDSYLEQRVLVLAAREKGLLKPGASAEEEQAAVARLLQDEVQSGSEVSEGEIAAYYDAHRAEFAAPESIVLHQILVPTENEARDVRRRLQKDPKSFELLAQTRSRGPEASQGGLLGRFQRGQLPSELEAAAFALAPGKISEVVQSPYGYHVLRVDVKDPAHDRSLAEARSEIGAQLRRQKVERATQQFVRGLLARAKVNHEAANPPAS